MQMIKRALGAGLLFSMVGCADRYTIRPTQLSMLNDDIAASGRNGEARLKVKLETIDGRIVEVDPPVWVYVTTRDGQESLLCSPLRVTFASGAMLIKHHCGPPRRFDGEEILKVQVMEN